MTPVFIHGPPGLTWETTLALMVPSPLVELAGSCGKLCEMNRKLSKFDQMSEPLPWMVQVPAVPPPCCGVRYTWLPGWMSVPISAQVKVAAQIPGGWLLAAVSMTFL